MPKKITALTQNTTPVLNDILLMTDDPLGTPLSQYITVQNLRGTYQLRAEIWNASPADGFTYYFGSFPTAALATSGSVRPVYAEKAGTITRVHLWYLVSGTPSAEASSLYLRKNHTTDTTLTTTLALNASGNTLVSGLNVAVAASDFFEIKWVCPTWATNPTGLYLQAVILVE